MQISPKEVIDRKIVIPDERYTSVQQVGIDLSMSQSVENLPHGSSVNVLLNEAIALPDDVYAQFFVRSSFSRKGIFLTTGVWDPGFKGSLGCTLYNMSGGPITINIGERVGQLVCYKANAASTYKGKYQGT